MEKQINMTELKVSESETKLPLIFESKDLWVTFRSFYATAGVFTIDMNKIQFLPKYWNYYSHVFEPIEIIYRTTLQSPIEKVREIINETWWNPDNCEVNLAYIDDYWFEHFVIDLKRKNITYSKEEKIRLDFAKKDSAESGWPAYEFTQAEIYNAGLLKDCGKYAIWEPPATSRTYGSYFISSSGSMTMLYHPSWADPSIIENGTLKLFDPVSAVNP